MGSECEEISSSMAPPQATRCTAANDTTALSIIRGMFISIKTVVKRNYPYSVCPKADLSHAHNGLIPKPYDAFGSDDMQRVRLQATSTCNDVQRQYIKTSAST
jgi:hypothetical protein